MKSLNGSNVIECCNKYHLKQRNNKWAISDIPRTKRQYLIIRPVYIPGTRTGRPYWIALSNLYETIYNRGDHECSRKLVRAKSHSDSLQSDFLCDGHTNYLLSTNQCGFSCFSIARPRQWSHEARKNINFHWPLKTQQYVWQKSTGCLHVAQN